MAASSPSSSSSSSLLSTMTDEELQNYSLKQHAWSQFEYRLELSRRFALAFNADHLIVFDDVAMVTNESERMISLSSVQGCDRSLLPALWLAMGFDYGATVLVYAPPNPIELRELLTIRKKFEQRLQRSIIIRILYDGLNDILALYQQSPKEYTALCLKYMTVATFRPSFTNEYHVQQLKKHADGILDSVRNKHRTLVFPFEVTPYHVQELGNDTRFILPDLPTNDKAKHNFVLRHCGFAKLPQLLMVCVDGTILDTYESYEKTMSSLSASETENTPTNIERFARAIIVAVDRLYSEHGLCAFVKLDAAGAGGWSCMSPEQHPPLYNYHLSQTERIVYVVDYIRTNVIDEHLPTHAVVEEFIDAELRPGDILADYTVCGLLLQGRFYPTSINLCGTDNAGQYIEQWTAAHAEFLDDVDEDWQAMFQTYTDMSQSESSQLHYSNGIYAGDLFISKNKRKHKQRDWNIRRGGRSTPETLIMIDDYEVNYECKVILNISAFELTDEQIFLVYTRTCHELATGPYRMYPFSTSYVYFGRAEENQFLKFNFLLNPSRLLDDEQKTSLPKCQHRQKVHQIVQQTADHHFAAVLRSKSNK